MHLLILGLFLVVGILVYYIMTTSPGNGSSSDGKKSKIKRRNAEDDESRVPEDLRKEGNVVFLPTAANGTEKPEDPENVSGSDPDQNA